MGPAEKLRLPAGAGERPWISPPAGSLLPRPATNRTIVANPQDQLRYRRAIGHFATGVAIITSQSPAGPAGLTTNALTSLSLDPLLLLVCFDNGSRTLPVVRESGRFGVNILRDSQHELAMLFASKTTHAREVRVGAACGARMGCRCWTTRWPGSRVP